MSVRHHKVLHVTGASFSQKEITKSKTNLNQVYNASLNMNHPLQLIMGNKIMYKNEMQIQP